MKSTAAHLLTQEQWADGQRDRSLSFVCPIPSTQHHMGLGHTLVAHMCIDSQRHTTLADGCSALLPELMPSNTSHTSYDRWVPNANCSYVQAILYVYWVWIFVTNLFKSRKKIVLHLSTLFGIIWNYRWRTLPKDMLRCLDVLGALDRYWVTKHWAYKCVQATYLLNSVFKQHMHWTVVVVVVPDMSSISAPIAPLSIIQGDHQIPTHRTTIVVSATTWKQHKRTKC